MLRLVIALLAVGLSSASCDPAPVAENATEVAPSKPASNAFPDATEVRLFVETRLDADGDPVLSKPNGLKLNPTQRAQFESYLVVEPIPESMTACFIPHHFFRYFDAKGRKVGEIEVCFCCGGVAVNGKAAILVAKDEHISADYRKLEAFVRSLGESTQVQCDAAD